MGGIGIEPEELKKGLKYLSARTIAKKLEAAEGDMYYQFAEDVADDALEYIKWLEMLAKPNEQIRWERNMAITQLNELGVGFGEKVEHKIPKWISVDDRLPEDNVNVVVYAYNPSESTIAITSYTHNMYGYNIEGWRTPWQYFWNEYKITHWMPLPEPPKEADA